MSLAELESNCYLPLYTAYSNSDHRLRLNFIKRTAHISHLLFLTHLSKDVPRWSWRWSWWPWWLWRPRRVWGRSVDAPAHGPDVRRHPEHVEGGLRALPSESIPLYVHGLAKFRRRYRQPLEPLPLLTEYNEDEKRVAELQTGFASRLRQSAYYIVESTKSTGKRASYEVATFV